MTALSLFVYGTLKRGESNHAHYASGYRAARTAALRGRLYLLPVGYPILAIPPESILAHGIGSPEADAQMQSQWAALSPADFPPAVAEPLEGDSWPVVPGEILTYDNPAAHLPSIDRLEAFNPGGESLYLRVLVQTLPPDPAVVWVYVAPPGAAFPVGTRPISGWPERPGA